MGAQTTEWDHNQWTRLYAKFESEFIELPRRLCMEIARLRASPPLRKVLEIGRGNFVDKFRRSAQIRSERAHPSLV